MTELGFSFGAIGILMLLSLGVASLFKRIRIPGILAFLLIGTAFSFLPEARSLLTETDSLSFLATLGTMFLLFYVGIQMEIQNLRNLGKDLLLLTLLVTVFPFIIGLGAMLCLGMAPVVSGIVALTRIPTAEAVVVPILDEFGLLRTRVGQFVVGAGTLDDILEIVLIVSASIWIAQSTNSGSITYQFLLLALGLGALVGLTFFIRRWFSTLAKNGKQVRAAICIAILLLFASIAESTGLGLAIGSLAAGIAISPGIIGMTASGSSLTFLRTVTYEFLGPMFFLAVGLSAQLGGILQAPLLTTLLVLSTVLGKAIGVFIMVLKRRLSVQEGVMVAVGLDAQLTTEIIVARMLFHAKMIDVSVFSALIAASSLTTIAVPPILALLARRQPIAALKESV